MGTKGRRDGGTKRWTCGPTLRGGRPVAFPFVASSLRPFVPQHPFFWPATSL